MLHTQETKHCIFYNQSKCKWKYLDLPHYLQYSKSCEDAGAHGIFGFVFKN